MGGKRDGGGRGKEDRKLERKAGGRRQEGKMERESGEGKERGMKGGGRK